MVTNSFRRPSNSLLFANQLASLLQLLLGLVLSLLFVGELTMFWVGQKVVVAQPLDPTLPGYEEVRPPARPILKIVTPENATQILGDKVTLNYILSGLKLVRPGSKKIHIRGEGYLKLIFAREGYPVPTPILFARKPPIVFPSIPPGKYRMTLEAVKNTGKSFDPPVRQTVKFTVIAPITPTPTPTPLPSPTPLPLSAQLRQYQQELLLLLGVGLILLPASYLLFLYRSK